MKKLIAIYSFLLLTTIACKYDKEEVKPLEETKNQEPIVIDPSLNDKPCDSILASFSLDILPLINNKCAPCHTENSFGGHKWTNYSEVNADKNLILSAINHESSTSNMPQGAAKLPDEEIKLVQCWIENGALNN